MKYCNRIIRTQDEESPATIMSPCGKEVKPYYSKCFECIPKGKIFKKPIFLGNGDFSEVECEKLKSTLQACIVSFCGLQQATTREEYPQEYAMHDEYIKSIVIALGGKHLLK